MHFSSLSLGLALTFVASSAGAHIVLDEPPTRSAADADMKVRPCGGRQGRHTDASKIRTYRPGQRVTLRWHETIPHAGYFRIAFSADGMSFPADPGATRPAVASPVLAVLPKVDGMTMYSTEITLPNMECSNCTLQLIQYMSGRAEPYYYQCGDIVLSNTAPAGGAGGAGGAAGSSSGGASGAGSSSGGASGAGAANGGASGAGFGNGGASTGGVSGGAPAGGTSNGGAGTSGVGGGLGASGASGSGGASSVGGAPGASAGSSSGGAATGSGGALSGSGTGGSAGPDDPGDDDGGCTLSASARGRSFAMFAAAAMALALGARRARRR